MESSPIERNKPNLSKPDNKRKHAPAPPSTSTDIQPMSSKYDAERDYTKKAECGRKDTSGNQQISTLQVPGQKAKRINHVDSQQKSSRPVARREGISHHEHFTCESAVNTKQTVPNRSTADQKFVNSHDINSTQRTLHQHQSQCDDRTIKHAKEDSEQCCPNKGGPTNYFLNCYHTNAACLMNKRGEFQEIVDLWKPKIIGVTESWCDNSVLDSEVALENYTLFRQDKLSGSNIGGVLLYIHDSLQATECKQINDFESCCWCEIKLSNNEILLTGVCYRSPNSSDENNERFYDYLKIMDTNKYSHILMFGDFNFREIKWDEGEVNASDSHPASKIYDITQDLYLKQHVDFPTRFREGQRP